MAHSRLADHRLQGVQEGEVVRLTEDEYRKLVGSDALLRRQTGMVVERGKSKYRNQPVIEDGQRFDSKLEARCYRWLKLRQSAGHVLWFIRQVPFRLEGEVIYRADFLAVLMTGGVEVIDAKGMLTRSTANKLKQVRARYGIDVVLWKG
jgi:hypothetical protein